MAEATDDTVKWMTALETALEEECDFGCLRNICRGRPVPHHLRPQIWQICLNVQGRGDSMASFDGLYDMPEQAQLREDCTALVEKLGNEDDGLSVVSDLESIITFYCKSKNIHYVKDNGWLEVIQPLLSAKYTRSELYNCFYTLVNRYITRECWKNGRPFHLFRLLLQYHDPELCSFLDTKWITPDEYSQIWFRSLFAAICDLQVIQNMWDVYFQHADTFLLFFLALVILVNARDQILACENESRPDIIELMTAFPAALEADDIEDFCALAQYYASRTPQSFRRDYQTPLFGNVLMLPKEAVLASMSQALCLPVSVQELLQPGLSGAGDGVKYFVVDCRPADQYNGGHLPTAFHLDANLMLQNPTEFNTAVQALFATQKQAIAAGSVAGGEHLCFMGSGREEEDQYVHMVVANFLQKNHQYVSVAKGGYAALHQALRTNLNQGLTDHSPKVCIVCNPDVISSASDMENGDEFGTVGGSLNKDSLLGKLSSVMKSKSAEMKERFSSYIKNDQMVTERHVSSSDKLGKRYRNMASVFTIGDDEEEGSTDDETKEVVSVETWFNKPEVSYSCRCKEVQENGYMYPSCLLLTDTHLFILREIAKEKGMAYIQSRHSLTSILKITSKKKYPDLITFRYGYSDDTGYHVTDVGRFIIPSALEATAHIKESVLKVLSQQEC